VALLPVATWWRAEGSGGGRRAGVGSAPFRSVVAETAGLVKGPPRLRPRQLRRVAAGRAHARGNGRPSAAPKRPGEIRPARPRPEVGAGALEATRVFAGPVGGSRGGAPLAGGAPRGGLPLSGAGVERLHPGRHLPDAPG